MSLRFKLPKAFGEAYHLAVAAYLRHRQGEKIAVDFRGRKDAEDLFRFLGVETLPYDSTLGPKKKMKETVKIFAKQFKPGCLDDLATIIRSEAHEREWPFPYDELKSSTPKLLIWQRNDSKHWVGRNSTQELVEQLVGLCDRRKAEAVILTGPVHGLANAFEFNTPTGDFYNHPFFEKSDTIPKQLWFLDTLFRCHGAIASVGMMSGALDGPAMFFGRKTVYFARRDAAEKRMEKVSKKVTNLIWQPIAYKEKFERLSSTELEELKHRLWE